MLAVSHFAPFTPLLMQGRPPLSLPKRRSVNCHIPTPLVRGLHLLDVALEPRHCCRNLTAASEHQPVGVGSNLAGMASVLIAISAERRGFDRADPIGLAADAFIKQRADGCRYDRRGAAPC
jgi:hypothetical protein